MGVEFESLHELGKLDAFNVARYGLSKESPEMQCKMLKFVQRIYWRKRINIKTVKRHIPNHKLAMLDLPKYISAFFISNSFMKSFRYCGVSGFSIRFLLVLRYPPACELGL
jgi:hypothetical protein